MKSFSTPITFTAQFLSLVFHPLLILTYSLTFLLWANPYEFGGGGMEIHLLSVVQVFFLTFMLPAISLLLMRSMQLIPSLTLENPKDRIIPYISTGVFYLWLSVNAYYTSAFPRVFTLMCVGATIALFLAFFVNIATKVSLHAVGMGGMLGIVLITLIKFSYDDISYTFLIALLIAGLVGTSRLVLDAHRVDEVFYGYLIGFVAQFIPLYLLH